MSTKTCPLCKKALSLKQINFNSAVYICEDLDCRYPIGFKCIEVERKLEDIEKDDINASNNKEDEDLDDWVNEVFVKNGFSEKGTLNNSPTNPPADTSKQNDDQTCDEIFDDILSFLNGGGDSGCK